MFIVDSHCHLNFPQFEGKIEEIIARADLHHVKVMQTICTKLSEFEDIFEIASKYKNVFCSVGVHPHEASSEKYEVETLLNYAKREKVIGIGETGLDYYYNNSPVAEQRKSFEKHIEVSRELQMPIIIHTRDADDDTIKILQSEMKKGTFPALIHCFTSSRKLADAVLEMGMYISISGIVTFKNATEIQNIAKYIPLDRILVETDAPFLAPVPMRGKTNEPAFTKYTLEYLANLRNVSVEELAETTTKNFFSLFTRAT